MGTDIHWMPAHTSEASVGEVFGSDGVPIDEVKWCSNQIVDLLAKESALANRVDWRTRQKTCAWQVQMRQLVMYLGKPTVEANAHRVGDVVLRDSEAISRRFRGVGKPRAKRRAKTSRAPVWRTGGLWRMPRRKGVLPRVPGKRPSSKVVGKGISESIGARNERAFRF